MTPSLETGLDIVKDQTHARRLLGAFLETGRLPHALLFTGMEGVGKKEAARAFAMACNCKSAPREGNTVPREALFGTVPCGRCLPCRKILTGNHPDIHVVESARSVIKIDRIRSLCHQLSLRPFEAKRRMAVIVDAPRMTQEAANCLLKVLEEPPSRTVWILTASQRSDLLPTIVSRCHVIFFHPLPESRIRTTLQKTCGFSKDEAAVLARMAHGSLPKAVAMAGLASEDASWLNQRKRLISASGLDSPETLASGSLLWCLRFAERLAAEKEHLFEILEILQAYLRDLVVLKKGSNAVFNRDLLQDMQQVSRHLSLDTLLTQMEVIQKAQRDLEAHVNPRLALETMMICLRKAYHEKSRRNPV